jgi:hypothetical protein
MYGFYLTFHFRTSTFRYRPVARSKPDLSVISIKLHPAIIIANPVIIAIPESGYPPKLDPYGLAP